MSTECSRCLLSEDVPGVEVDSEETCSVCNSYDRVWADWDKKKHERRQELDTILDKARRKGGPYDVLVPLSGGKDSTYVLYLCAKTFNLKCLAVTWDNGFLSDHARENIKNSVEILNIDHVFYGLSPEKLMRLYRGFFLKTGIFCSVCMRGIATTIAHVAKAFDIPLIITGTSFRTEEHVAPEFFESGELSYFQEVLKGEDFAEDADALISDGGLSETIRRVLLRRQINLPDYIDWNYEEIYRVIFSELGWDADRPDAEHSDCLVDDVVHYFRYRKYSALIPEMLRFSKLVTVGQMTREEAASRVEGRRASLVEPANLDWFLGKLEIDRAEMDHVLAEPSRHMRFFKQDPLVRRSLRFVKQSLVDPLLGRN